MRAAAIVKIAAAPEEIQMSTTEPRHSHAEAHEPPDGLESIVPAIPLVLPVMGGVLMFLLAFIAIYMA
jgi:hypothetical protein